MRQATAGSEQLTFGEVAAVPVRRRSARAKAYHAERVAEELTAPATVRPTALRVCTCGRLCTDKCGWHKPAKGRKSTAVTR